MCSGALRASESFRRSETAAAERRKCRSAFRDRRYMVGGRLHSAAENCQVAKLVINPGDPGQ
jgi:hypothetical protein